MPPRDAADETGPSQKVPAQDWMLTWASGKGRHTGPVYRNVAEPEVSAGQAASEALLESRGRASMPGCTGMGGAGENEKAPGGCTPNCTVTVAVPALSIGNTRPLPVS